MTLSNKYYVYKHIDPETKETVYYGHGFGGRAWQCGSTHSPLRSLEHKLWADNLLEKGFIPSDWVVIVFKELDKNEAKKLETKYIHKFRPKFNKTVRYSGLKFTKDLFDKAFLLRKSGKSFAKIATELNLSPMTIYRGLNNKTISLETALAERP